MTASMCLGLVNAQPTFYDLVFINTCDSSELALLHRQVDSNYAKACITETDYDEDVLGRHAVFPVPRPGTILGLFAAPVQVI